MSIFSQLATCVVYVWIVSLLSTSLSCARNLGSTEVGVINKMDPQDTTLRNDRSKSLEKTKLNTMVPSKTNGTNTTITMQQETQIRSNKLEEKEIENDINPIKRCQLDDHNHNHDNELKDQVTTDDNGSKIRAQSRNGNESNLPTSPIPKGNGSSHRTNRNKKVQPAMVTWRVPRKKKKKGLPHQQEEQPDFDLDYAPPKVHPPTHN